MTKKKAKKTDPVVLQIAQDVAQIEARIESLTQSGVAHNGAVEGRLRNLESAVINNRGTELDAVGDVYNITVSDGGTANFSTR